VRWNVVAFLALFVGAACATTPEAEPAPTSEDAAPAVEATPDAETPENPVADPAACIAECEQQSMARSVAWEIVQADCRAACSGDRDPLQETLTPDAGQ
jgi:hypothetical protein